MNYYHLGKQVRTSLRTILILCAVLIAQETLAQKATPTLNEILTKHYTAIGGAEGINKLSSYIIRGRYVNSSGTWKKNYRVFVSNQNVRSEMDIQTGMMSVQAFDGKAGWNINPWSGSLTPQPMNAQSSAMVANRSEMLRNDLITYKEKNTTLEYKGIDEIDGSDCYKISAIRKDGIIREYYLDVDSYLIVKVVTKMTIDGEEENDEIMFSNYKKVNNVYLPFAIENEGGGGVYIDSFDNSTPIDGNMFTMPKEEKPATQNP
jgi:hypothetical protein